jgi:hypothetical protein
MSDLRYPIGRFQRPEVVTAALRAEWIETIESLPVALRRAVDGLSDVQLETPYRPEGWTVRQVVHHLADSHFNSFVRFKLGLTEQNPTIKPYEESLWAQTADANREPVASSLVILDGLHARFTSLLRSMTEDDFSRTVHHPGMGRSVTLESQLGIYAWHSRHHTAHVTTLRERMGW